jgi:TPR repeat protein
MIQEALSFYKDANDYGSVVRVLCHVDQVPAALKLALESNDPMACFQLARYYEQMNNIREAIVYYSKSNRLHHAIRLAMDQALDQEVMTMSLMSSKSVMIQSA